MPLRRTPIKRKRARYPSPAQERERREWKEQWDRCWICGVRLNENLQCHEIASKAQAPDKWADVRNYFACCGVCNTHVLNNLPESLQLMYKRHFDPVNYDRVLINRLRRRADNAIEEREVNVWKEFVEVITCCGSLRR